MVGHGQLEEKKTSTLLSKNNGRLQLGEGMHGALHKLEIPELQVYLGKTQNLKSGCEGCASPDATQFLYLS